MEMFDRISNDIKDAMKAKDKVRLETLRNIKKVFLEAKTAPGANDTLTDDAAMKIMQKLVKQGKNSAALYNEQGRADLAEAELAQVAVIETYLPKQMSAEELEEKEEEKRIRREKFYDKDSSSKIRRKPRRNIYLFSPEDLDNDNIISMVETIPTFQRSKDMLDSLQTRISADNGFDPADNSTNEEDNVIHF